MLVKQRVVREYSIIDVNQAINVMNKEGWTVKQIITTPLIVYEQHTGRPIETTVEYIILFEKMRTVLRTVGE